MKKLKSLKKNNCKIRKFNKKTIKKIKITNKKGGKLVGKGSFGCVYSPPLDCEIPCTLKKCKTGVSKFMTLPNANYEKQNIDLLFKDFLGDKSQYFIIDPHQCKPKYKIKPNENCNLIETPYYEQLYNRYAKNKYSLLIYENGGNDLYKYMNGTDFHFLLVLQGLLNILEGIGLLISNNIIHADIKEENIVIGLSIKKPSFRLIDFGLSIKYNNPNIQPTEKEFDSYNIPSNFNLPVYTFFLDRFNKKLDKSRLSNNDISQFLNNIYIIFRDTAGDYTMFLYDFFVNDIDEKNIEMKELQLIMSHILSKNLEEKINLTEYLTEDLTEDLTYDIAKYLGEIYLHFLNVNLDPFQRFIKIARRVDLFSFGLILFNLLLKYLKLKLKRNIVMDDISVLEYSEDKMKSLLSFIVENQLLQFDLNIELPPFEKILENYKIMISELVN